MLSQYVLIMVNICLPLEALNPCYDRERSLKEFPHRSGRTSPGITQSCHTRGLFSEGLISCSGQKEGKKSEKGGSYHPHNHYCSSSSKQESKTVAGKYLEWSLHRNMNNEEKLTVQWTLGTWQTFSHWWFVCPSCTLLLPPAKGQVSLPLDSPPSPVL